MNWKYSGRPADYHLVETEDGRWNVARVQSKEAAILIAAAPEMLDALKRARTTLSNMPFDSAASTMVDAITVVIEKAEGKE